MKMIDKIANAIEGADVSDDLRSDDKYREMADAAIKAMREPSMWMCMAHGAKPWDEWTVYDLWRAMIDRVHSPSIEDTFAKRAGPLHDSRNPNWGRRFT